MDRQAQSVSQTAKHTNFNPEAETIDNRGVVSNVPLFIETGGTQVRELYVYFGLLNCLSQEKWGLSISAVHQKCVGLTFTLAA